MILWYRSLLFLTACQQQETDHIHLTYSQLQKRKRRILQASIKKSLHWLSTKILQIEIYNGRREGFLDPKIFALSLLLHKKMEKLLFKAGVGRDSGKVLTGHVKEERFQKIR